MNELMNETKMDGMTFFGLDQPTVEFRSLIQSHEQHLMNNTVTHACSLIRACLIKMW